jgi:hypothetical protein
LICLDALDKIIILVVYNEIKGDINFISNLNCQVNHVGRKDEAEERHWLTFTQNNYSCSDWLKSATSA